MAYISASGVSPETPAPLVRGGALSTARILRWAFNHSPNRRVHPKGVTDFPR